MSSTVLLGNTNPLSEEVTGNRVTTFEVPDDVGVLEAATSIRSAYDGYHSADPPEWVESDNPFLAQALAEAYTWPETPEPTEDDPDAVRPAHTCTVGRASDWVGEDEHAEPDPEVDPEVEA